MARVRSWTEELRLRIEERDRAANDRRARSQASRTHEQRQAENARKRQTRKRRAASKLPGPFVAIDAEGMDIGDPFEVVPDDPKLDYGLGYDPASAAGRLMAQDHATFLWGAGDASGRPLWLGEESKRPLTAGEVLHWLTSLPMAYGQDAIFVMFAASYDWTQIIRHMPPEKQWEIWKGMPWPRYLRGGEWPAPDDYKDQNSFPNRYVLWGEYALSLLPGKRLKIGKLRDRNHPKDAKRKWDFIAKPITIFDAFGFFQMKFTEAVSGYGESVLTPAEFKQLQEGTCA
jgi:hypothetical protein